MLRGLPLHNNGTWTVLGCVCTAKLEGVTIVVNFIRIAAAAAIVFFSPAAFAQNSAEEAFHYGNSVGKSGWNIYATDEDDADEELERVQEETARRAALLAEEKKKKKQREQDFFSTGIGIYDESLSRTENEERELTTAPR